MTTTPTDIDDTEHDLRMEIMRLDRDLKLLELRRIDQQLAFGPVKILLVTGTVIAVLVAIVSAICLA